MKLSIVGQQGSGKTLLSVILARLVQSRYPETMIYSNVYSVDNDPSWVTINDLADFPFDDHKKFKGRVPPKILILDEAMFSVSSRGSGSNINELWSRALAYFRKNNVVLTIFATHRVNMLDNRFREQLDGVIMCRKNPSYFDYLLVDMVTHIQKPFRMAKTPSVFNFANYNTYEMPMPIEVIRLQEHPLFQLKKIERKKVKAQDEHSPTGASAVV